MDTNAAPSSSLRKTLPWLVLGIVSAFSLGLVGCSLLQPATPVAERPPPGTNIVHDPTPPATTPPKPQRPDSEAGPRMAETRHNSATPMKGAEKLVTPNPSASANADPSPHFTPVVTTAAVTKDTGRTTNRASVASLVAPKELIFKGPPRQSSSSRWFVWVGLVLSLGIMGAIEWYYASRRGETVPVPTPEKAPDTEDPVSPAPTKENTTEPSPEPTPVAAVATSNAPA